MNGWLAPDGSFLKAEPTPPTRMRGMGLGGHEQAALNWLEKTEREGGEDVYLWHRELYDYATKEAERLGIEFNCWDDLDGHDIIKRFFESKGFKRVAEDEE